jgi:ribosomal-protein-alanine N-acetyltransferase
MMAVVRIDERCFGRERFSETTVMAFLRRDDAFSLLAEEDGEPVGAALCMFSELRGEGRIASIAVLKEHRQKGIGSALLRDCEMRLQSNGVRTVWLEVKVENVEAIDLYLRHGYTLRAMIKDYYSSRRHAYAMEKVLESKKERVLVIPS